MARPTVRDFMPEAQSIADRRASPLAGTLIFSVAGLIGAALVWSAWAEVERVVVAAGKVEPASQVKIINHPTGGKIETILVENGDRVRKGDILVTFDPSVIEAELAATRGRLQVRQAEVARLEAEHGDRPIALPDNLASERPDLADEQLQLLDATRVSRAQRSAELEATVRQRQNEVERAEADIERLKNALTLIRRQANAVRELAEKGLYPKLKMVALEGQVSDTTGELAKARSAAAAAREAASSAEERLAALDKSRTAELLGDLADAKADVARLLEQRKIHEARLRGLVVHAPVTGIIEAVEVTAAGQSVAPNEPLMTVVPTQDGLVVEATVANKDIGFVHQGQTATIKVRAFDFLEYGTLDGKVEMVAADARPTPDTSDLLFDVKLSSERDELASQDRSVAIAPGMLVDVEFHVGERTVLSYLTDRILAIKHKVFREG
ncbi:MAG: HlyD family type I secretion periplasmic adaptor subunit [Geminicoccaceae bacterium]